MDFEFYRGDIEAMKASLEMCARQGLEREEIIIDSIGHMMEYYENNPEKEYLLGAILQIQAYLELGFSYDRHEVLFDNIVSRTGKTRYEIFSGQFYMTAVIRLNKSQIRGMLRKWSPSHQNEMSIKEVVEDIYEKVSKKLHGIYRYVNHSASNVNGDDVYELVINDKECYFHDLKYDRYYTFK